MTEQEKIERLAEQKILMGWVPFRINQQMKAQQEVVCPACHGEGCNRGRSDPCVLCDDTCMVTRPEAELWEKADMPDFKKLEIVNEWRAKLLSTS